MDAKSLLALDNIALAAPPGLWRHPKTARYGEVISDAEPATEGYDGLVIAESCVSSVGEFLVAFQPRVVHAMIAYIWQLEFDLVKERGNLDAALGRIDELKAHR